MSDKSIKISELPRGVFDSTCEFVTDDVDQNETSGYATKKHLASEIANKTLNSFAYITSPLQTTAKTIVGAINEVQPYMGKILTGTLEAGDTSITFTDEFITTTKSYDYYTNTHIEPTSVTISNGQAILTFEEQEVDIQVEVVIF